MPVDIGVQVELDPEGGLRDPMKAPQRGAHSQTIHRGIIRVLFTSENFDRVKCAAFADF